MKKVLVFFALVLFSLSFSSAIVVTRVSVDDLSPGQETTVFVDIENILQETAEAVSINLIFSDVPFTPVGNSEDSIDEIKENREKTFSFGIRAPNDIDPGNYEIPYELEYEIDNDKKLRKGTIGIKVVADTELTFTIGTDNPVIGQEGKILLKAVNKGFTDARFVSVKILPEGYTLVSDQEIYIGTIDSDDFETASFDVIFGNRPRLKAIIEYIDFDNQKVIQNIDLEVNVFTKEKAEELGIIEKNNTVWYILLVVAFLIIWIIWRKVIKKMRNKKSKAGI